MPAATLPRDAVNPMRWTGPTKLRRDPRTPPSWYPANESEIVEPETNAMQANLLKKFDRTPGDPATVERQVFMKFGNFFAEL